MMYFTDQTPTPTKFLRYGEEIGLFHELTKSPFDEAFRKANTNDVNKYIYILFLVLLQNGE